MDLRLIEQLERSRALGFLGPGPVEDHVLHSSAFVDALVGIEGRVIDLGSGGGIPGLVVALARPDLELVLVDAMGKRCRFLETAIAALEVTATVVEGRAEVVGRGPLRGTASAVLARSFGPPAVTAECGAPLLRVGGLLLVSEPPAGLARWAPDGVAQLGLALGPRHEGAASIQALELVEPCPDRYPRRDGMPTKRPLF